MENAAEEDFGTKDIRKLLIKQAVPASIGILFMTVNILVDTIFVGRWIGPQAIAALTVVSPVVFIIASIGLAIGIGGSSVISRAFGEKDSETAHATFAHQIMMAFGLTMLFVVIGFCFSDQMLTLFGAKGNLLAPAKLFLFPILAAAPFMAFIIMGNGVMRAEDRSKFAMIVTMISAVANIILDILLIKVLNLGIPGAAYATAFSYVIAFGYIFWFFRSKSSLKLQWKHFTFRPKLFKEISGLSLSPFSRQSVISILSILLNHVLFAHGGEHSVTIYGIISRLLMFALFPVSGITEGFLPIAGFNYGAKKYDRVREIIVTAIKYAGFIAILIYSAILIFAPQITAVFTDDQTVIRDTPNALRWVFAASPVIAVQLIGSAYFQAAGKASKALLLTLTKQGFFLIPLILVLPRYFGIFGVWISFPIADVLATSVTGFFLWKEMKQNLK